MALAVLGYNSVIAHPTSDYPCVVRSSMPLCRSTAGPEPTADGVRVLPDGLVVAEGSVSCCRRIACLPFTRAACSFQRAHIRGRDLTRCCAPMPLFRTLQTTRWCRLGSAATPRPHLRSSTPPQRRLAGTTMARTLTGDCPLPAIVLWVSSASALALREARLSETVGAALLAQVT